MDLNVQIDGAAVNQFMAEKILESTLGEAIKKAVTAHLKELDSTWNSPLKNVIHAEVNDMVRALVREEYAPKVADIVHAHLTDEVMKTLAQKMVEKAMLYWPGPGNG